MKKRQPRFKASEYKEYNSKLGLDRYGYLYCLMSELWKALSLNEQVFEDDTRFKCNGMICYIDKKNGSYCEVIGTGWLNIYDRIAIHEAKIKQYYTRKN